MDFIFQGILIDYGVEKGDSQLPKGDTKFVEIDLVSTFIYMNIEYTKISVTVNGYVGFVSRGITHYISVYECPMSNKNPDSDLFYRYTEDYDSLIQFQPMILNLTNGTFDILDTQFDSLSAFVITWSNLKLQNSTATNTFQLILLRTFFKTFLILSYGNLTKLNPKVCFRHSTNYANLMVQYPYYLDSTFLSNQSNVNEPGVHIYEVNSIFFK